MIYCCHTTQSHPVVTAYPSIICCLDVLMLREGCDLTPTPFKEKNTLGIDGDELETRYSLSKGTSGKKSKSVDLIFGLNTLCYQFVELKFRSDNFRWLDKSSFLQKVNGTKIALGGKTNVNQTYYIVFKTNKVQQARNYLFRQNPILNSDFKVVDINGLFSIFFS